MPYSLSHAVIALPVFAATRGKIPLAAVIAGSISPDFPYMLALTPIHAPGHSAIGALLYCVIPSLLVLSVWYRWLEKPTLDLLGLPQQSRNVSVSGLCLMLAGVLIGTYSHVLWDATSHSTGVFVQGSQFWNMTLFSLPLYKWNQYGSGVVGLIVLSAWYLFYRSRHRWHAYRGRPWLGISIFTVCIVVCAVLANVIHASSHLYEYVVRSAVGFATGGAIGTCVYSLLVNLQSTKSSAGKQGAAHL